MIQSNDENGELDCGGDCWIEADPNSHAIHINFQYSDGEVNTMVIDDFDLGMKFLAQATAALEIAFPDQMAELEADDDLEG